MEMDAVGLARIADIFRIPTAAASSIIKTLTYQPIRKFWDPFWQPIIPLSGGRYLIAPHLIVTSSSERNLITLLNRSSAGREFYNRVSTQKEEDQLSGLSRLFCQTRYRVRSRALVPRNDGSTLTDIDLLVYDSQEQVLLLTHAKWLIRPDTVQEVLAKDDEVAAALAKAANAASRVKELGSEWISQALEIEVAKLPKICSLVINRDFVPSGWVYHDQIPVVNMDFVTSLIGSRQFTGLDSLYEGCANFYESLKKKHPLKVNRDEIQYGDYVFEFPTIEHD